MLAAVVQAEAYVLYADLDLQKALRALQNALRASVVSSLLTRAPSAALCARQGAGKGRRLQSSVTHVAVATRARIALSAEVHRPEVASSAPLASTRAQQRGRMQGARSALLGALPQSKALLHAYDARLAAPHRSVAWAIACHAVVAVVALHHSTWDLPQRMARQYASDGSSVLLAPSSKHVHQQLHQIASVNH